MRILHLSDLHIGLKLFTRDLSEDQKNVFDQIYKYCEDEKPDAIVIAGDIYDKAVPSAEAVELFDEFLTGIRNKLPDASIMMISGNHDSAPRINCFRNVLNKQNIYMVGQPPKEGEYIEKVTLTDQYGDVNFYLLPFVKPSMIKSIVGTDDNGNNLSYDESMRKLIERENIDVTMRNVLVSHQFFLPKGSDGDGIERAESEIKVAGNIDQILGDVVEDFDYVALGHIHKPMVVGKEHIRYCGTPLQYSVSEAGQKKSVVLVDLNEKGDREITILPLTPLRQIKKVSGNIEEILASKCEDYVSVVLTDLTGVENYDLVDRIRGAFPYCLEIKREIAGLERVRNAGEVSEDLEPEQICREFFKNVSENEMEIVMSVLEELS